MKGACYLFFTGKKAEVLESNKDCYFVCRFGILYPSLGFPFSPSYLSKDRT